MNRLSHILFGFSLFVGLYSLVWAFSVWTSEVGRLLTGLSYYCVGGIALSVVVVPILFYKAPHRKHEERTTSDTGALGALTFVCFSIGSLIGMTVYAWMNGIVIAGNISLSIGLLLMEVGALMPDWDIPFLGIERHRNVIFHSCVLPLLITGNVIYNVTAKIVTSGSLQMDANLELYATALFLLGYASHLYLDIFPNNASAFEILWRVMDPHAEAPTGLKPLGPIEIHKKAARSWLVGNASLLVMVALALFGLYFYNVSMMPSP